MTLGDGATTITLPPALLWKDEFEWSGVAVAEARAISGKMIRQTAAKIAGMPITLEPDESDQAWIAVSQLTVLRSWTDVADKVMTLTRYSGETFTVRFRFDGGPPIKAAPVMHMTDRQAGDWFILQQLNLITTA